MLHPGLKIKSYIVATLQSEPSLTHAKIDACDVHTNQHERKRQRAIKPFWQRNYFSLSDHQFRRQRNTVTRQGKSMARLRHLSLRETVHKCDIVCPRRENHHHGPCPPVLVSSLVTHTHSPRACDGHWTWTGPFSMLLERVVLFVIY
jgi:hypothetical protein